MKQKPADGLETPDVSSVAISAIIPVLHAYAMRRLRSKSHADDAVQDTIERAWRARASFVRGASLKNWMFGILRNQLIDVYRIQRRLTQDVDGVEAARLATQPDQLWRLHYADTVAAMETLSSDQRRAILLVVFGLTNMQAAAVMDCPLGTLKSHLRLGRHKLRALGV